MWLLASVASWAMFTLGVVLMIVVLLRNSLRHQRFPRRAALTSDDSPAASQTPSMSAPHPAFHSGEIALHETARELKAELDSKAAVLQTLLAQAAAQTARLEAAIAQANSMGLAHRAVRSARGSLKSGDHSYATPSETARPAATSPQARGLLLPVDDKCRKRIYALADQGYSPELICQSVEATVGEIEMVLRLRE